jgi:hypothetical protein
VANCGSLPLGAVLQPFAPAGAASSAPPRLRREPARCQICGAFVNRFCGVDARNGRWACVFCGASSFCREFAGAERAVRLRACACACACARSAVRASPAVSHALNNRLLARSRAHAPPRHAQAFPELTAAVVDVELRAALLPRDGGGDGDASCPPPAPPTPLVLLLDESPAPSPPLHISPRLEPAPR